MTGSSTQVFDIHGVAVRVETELAALAAGVADLLQRFPTSSLDNGEVLRLNYRSKIKSLGRTPSDVSPPRGELLFSSAWDNAFDLTGRLGISLDIYGQDGHLLLDYHRHGRILLNKGQGILTGHLAASIELHSAPLASFFFLLPLSELLAYRGLHMVHAAALERKGRGVLIPGMSGSGKTTCCVSLVRAGYRCLSDDKPFLRENGNGIQLLAFPERIDVTERTISFFPELSGAPPGVLKAGYRKKHFHPEALYPGSTAETGRPDLILFPQISGEPKSRLEKLSKIRAIETLLPHGLVVLDPEQAKRRFDLLTRLVEGAECYRLHFGNDVLELPRLVDALLG
ncbi:MAG TPA: hypothetical protein VFF86_00810 [Candidatus Methylomirabilis sp.]|nr:hypothetical protein [Candidatus Methylomirabilis sp.]